MPASKLVHPDILYKQSYLEALQEYHDNGEVLYLQTEKLSGDTAFKNYITDLNNEDSASHYPIKDWMEPVREVVLWLVKDGTYLGHVHIRRRLNWHLEKWGGHIGFYIRPSMRGKGFGKKILQKSLKVCAELGIDKMLITVDPENKAAIRVIEFCGGVQEDHLNATEVFPERLTYWIQS